MKGLKLGLLNNVVSTYDSTKTTIKGNIHQKTLLSKPYLGPALNKWIDVFVDSGVTPVGIVATSNGRVFVCSTETATIVTVSCYDFNFITGASTYIGKITMRAADTAATTHIIRSFKVQDNAGVTGWKIFLVTTGSVIINGGAYCSNNVDKADFTFLGTDFPFATGSNQKATYLLQDPSNIGVGQLNIASVGSVLDTSADKLYVHNGVSATHQYYVYNTAATLNCPQSLSLVITSSASTVTQVGHGYLNNDPLFITNLSGGAGLVNNTNYFTRNVTANTYQLSATTGGAIINITTNGTADISRSFGTTGNAFVLKTGNLPALTGTLIAADSEDFAIPQHTANSGFSCAFFGTTSNMYMGRLSELTSGVTTWASLVVVNNNSDSSTISQTARAYSWSTTLDRAVINTTGSLRLIFKQMVNSFSDRIFGRANISVYEAQNPTIVYIGANTETNVIGIDFEQGWLFLASNAIGQRGIIATDVRSDSLFDYSNIYTPVLSTTNAILTGISRIRAYDNQTDGILVSYRTSGFGVETGGWIPLTSFDSYNIPISTQIQFKIQFDTFTKEAKGLPAQVNELIALIESPNEISDNWEFSDDFSDNTTPSRVAFRLKQTYVGIIPTLYFRATDLSNSLLINNNTVSNASNFQYSVDSGTTWLPLGTIPNTIGTLIRYTFTTPPGVTIRPSLREI